MLTINVMYSERNSVPAECCLTVDKSWMHHCLEGGRSGLLENLRTH